jgi:hypothetical protein
LERIAIAEHWRLISVTKSDCTPVDVVLWHSDLNRRYTECDTWHERAISRIQSEEPALVVVSSAHIYEFVSGGVRVGRRPDLWDAGLGRMITSLAPADRHVAFLGDTPYPGIDVPNCLSAHLDNALACARPVTSAIDVAQSELEAAIVRAAGGSFIDPGLWVCPADPCPAVIGRYLVYRDNNHIATPFAFTLAQQLLDALPAMAN